MEGKRVLKKLRSMSTVSTEVYECEACAWMLRVPVGGDQNDVQAEFGRHDCKANSLKKRPVYAVREPRSR
jgi:hypothetical protein